MSEHEKQGLYRESTPKSGDQGNTFTTEARGHGGEVA
jgi:hypothetical protein